MLCESCGKNEAYIHYTKIVNGKHSEVHLCEECALKHYDLDTSFNVNNLFTGLIDGFKDKTESVDLKWCKCGLSYSDFKKIGKFGCSKCYETFKPKLEPLIGPTWT